MLRISTKTLNWRRKNGKSRAEEHESSQLLSIIKEKVLI